MNAALPHQSRVTYELLLRAAASRSLRTGATI